jgi:hypothetical protein
VADPGFKGLVHRNFRYQYSVLLDMTEYVTLLCPQGAYDAYISDGTQHFKPYRANIYSEEEREFGGPWLVDVPIHLVDHFLGRGGFSVMSSQTEPPAVPTNMVRLRKIDGSAPPWGDYVPDENGTILVPHDHHASALWESHGYELVHVVETQPEAAAKPKEAAERPVEIEGEQQRRVPKR